MTKQKAKSIVSKEKKSRAKKNMDTFFLRAKSLYTQTPGQGVTVSNYIYAGWQLIGGLLQNNAEFNFYRLQYDKFRVNKIRIVLTPKANVFDQANAQNDQTLTLTGDGMIHTVVDRDGIAPSSIAQMSRYPSYKAYSVMKKFSRAYSVKYPTGVWLDCQDPAGNPQLIATLGLGGGITLYGENFVEDSGEVWNEPLYQVEVLWDVVFCGKTSGGLSFTTGEDGLVTGVSITNTLTGEALKPLVGVQGIRGTISDQLIVPGTVAESDPMSGQTVTIDDSGNPVV